MKNLLIMFCSMFIMPAFADIPVAPPFGVIPIVDHINVKSIALSTSVGPYKIYANGLHEAPLTFNVETYVPLKSDVINKATILYNAGTQKIVPVSKNDVVANNPTYSYEDNGYKDPIIRKTLGDGYHHSVSTVYFKTTIAKYYKLCARIYTTQAVDGQNKHYIDSCSDSEKPSFATIEADASKIYSSEDFIEHAHYKSYYKWSAALNWMWTINYISLNAKNIDNGFYIKTLEDKTGENGHNWGVYGTNFDTISGMGGINDGRIDGKGYAKYPVSKKGIEKWDDDSYYYKSMYYAKIYNTGDRFAAKARPDVFVIGSYHGPAGTGNWGLTQKHEMVGLDNFGNKIDVYLPVCAGACSY